MLKKKEADTVIKTFRAALAALLVLAVGVTVGGSVSAQPAGPLPVLAGHVRIMFSGDSTSAGYPVTCSDGSPFGDRWTLGHWLTLAGGLDIEFVGSQNATCAQPYGHHDGYATWTIRDVADNIGGFLAAHPAEILIVRVGVNDASSWSGWRSAAQMAADYTRLIDNARAQIPTIRIGASEIPPPDGMASADLARASVTVREFNRGLRATVAPYGDSVHVIELGRIMPLLLGDGLHPSPNGYEAVAAIEMHDIWPWLSDRPPPAVKLSGIPLDPWR